MQVLPRTNVKNNIDEREREREIESRMKMGWTPMHMRDYFTLI